MAALHSHILALFSELAGTISAAAGLHAGAVDTVIDGLSSHVRELRTKLNTDRDLQIYINSSPSHPSSGSNVSLDLCNKEVRTALHTFIRRVVLCEPDTEASYRVARVIACLDYVQKHFKQHLASNGASTYHVNGPSTGSTAGPSFLPAVVFNAPPSQPFACNTAFPRARLLAAPSTVGATSGTVTPLPLLCVQSWTGLPPPPFQRSGVGHYDDAELEQGLLAGETKLRAFVARVSGEGLSRDSAGKTTEMEFLGNGSDVSPGDILTVAALHKAAPNLSRLAIDIPIAPSISEPGLAPELRYLLVDAANRMLGIYIVT
ncbi:hypothetical protein AURDEDRAFT_162782 [Auricularia subglabra TFB-10046 SS5]|nr:hypothetical protein AURDEDRAFT_162782 [Auricularia subglabra TFB-10046 SS5]